MPLDEIPQLDEVDQKLDDLVSPTSLEVYEAMLPYDNDMVAAAGIQRALSGGGGGAPSGPAGGDLAGTYPNPTISSGAATDGQVLTADGAGGSDWEAASGGTPPAKARAVYGGVTQFSLPGIAMTGGPNPWTSSANRAQYFPFFVESSIVIDRIIFELLTGVAASTVRVCIYEANTSWQPGTMVANTDTGDLTATAAQQGIVSTTITDTTLAPNRYLFWFGASSGNHVLRSYGANVTNYLGFAVALGGSPFFSQIYAAQTYGAPPGSGLAWDSASFGSAANTFSFPLFLRIKTA